MKAKKLLLICALGTMSSVGIAQTITHVHDWSWGRGSEGHESGEDVVVSNDEYNYTAGTFEQTVDFDPFSSTQGSVSSNGSKDIYICKRDKDGHFVWVRSFGGSSYDDVVAIDIDSESNVYITGRFYGTVDFDPSPTASFNMVQTGTLDADVYISKFDENGNFIWAKQLKGTSTLVSTDIFVDDRNDVHVVGYFYDEVDVNPAPYVFAVNLLTSAGTGDKDGFSVTLNQNGIYQKSYHLKGSNSAVSIEAVYVDAGYNQFFTGDFTGTCDFDRESTVHNMTSTGSSTDAFIMRVDPFNGFEWARQLKCSTSANAKGIEMDANGDLYSVGTFSGTIDLDPSTGINNHVKSSSKVHTYISKLGYSGHFDYGRSISGTGPAFVMGNVYAEGLAVTDNGQVYVTGHFDKKVDFNSGMSSYDVTAAGKKDAFIVGLNTSGNFWSINLIEPNYSDAYAYSNAIDLSQGEDIYTTGRFTRMVDFNAVASPHWGISIGGFDMYTHKLERYTPFPSQFSKSMADAENNQVEVYPNPSSSLVNLNLTGDEAAQVSLVTISGKVVYDTKHDAGRSVINLENFDSGTYILLITQGDNTQRVKVVKE